MNPKMADCLNKDFFNSFSLTKWEFGFCNHCVQLYSQLGHGLLSDFPPNPGTLFWRADEFDSGIFKNPLDCFKCFCLSAWNPFKNL